MNIETFNKANSLADQLQDLRHLSESLEVYRPGDVIQETSLIRLAIEYNVLDGVDLHDKVMTSIKVRYEAVKDELERL